MLSDTLDAVRSGIPDSAADVSSALAGPVSVIDLSSRWEGRTVHVVFSRGEREPLVVVKVDTRPRYQPRLRAEQAALEHAAGIPALSGRVPRPLGLVDTDAGLVFTQSALPGVPLSVLLSRRLRPGRRPTRRDHARVGRWLRDLRSQTSGATTTVEVDVVVERLDQALPPDLQRRREFIDGVAALGAALGPLRVPMVPIHGDLAPSNCLVSRSGVSFVDWEGAVPEAEPLAEIVLFLNHYARATPMDHRRRPDPTAAFRRAFTDDHWLAEVTRSTWLQQLADLGLPTEAADYLLVATLTDLASGHAPTAHARRAGSRRNWTELLTIFAQERRVA